MDDAKDVARKFRFLLPAIRSYQDSFTAIEQVNYQLFMFIPVLLYKKQVASNCSAPNR